MKGLMICALATMWLLGLRYMNQCQERDRVRGNTHNHLCWYCWEIKRCTPSGCKDAPSDYMCDKCAAWTLVPRARYEQRREDVAQAIAQAKQRDYPDMTQTETYSNGR